MSGKIWSKDEIKSKLVSIDLKVKNQEPISENDLNWLTRSLVAIYEGQTHQEKITMTTTEDNGIGFNGVDATILTSFAEQWNSRKWLSTKQIAILAKKMPKYAGQLAKIAAAKAQPKLIETNVVAEASETPVVDGMITFPNGASINCLDLAPEYDREGEIVAWTNIINSVQYTLIND